MLPTVRLRNRCKGGVSLIRFSEAKSLCFGERKAKEKHRKEQSQPYPERQPKGRSVAR